MPRLFIATALSREALARAERVEDQLRRALRRRVRVRWTRQEGRHVTLAFLGQVGDERVETIAATMQKVALAHGPMDVEVHGVGAFPNARRARVVWIGVHDPGGGLGALAVDLQTALREDGYAIDDREFRGHLTLGRVADRSGVEISDVMEIDDAEPTRVHVDSLVLFESQLAPSGARYHQLRKVRLGEGG